LSSRKGKIKPVKTRSKRAAVEWLPSPEMPPLVEAEVHVWRAWLQLDAPRIEALRRTLSEGERCRAERFRFQADRVWYTVAHGVLRQILAHYLGVSTTALEFAEGEHGKPSLIAPRCGGRLRFNLSHSGNLALVAIAQDREVGVDLEFITGQVDAVEIARRFFSAREASALSRMSVARRGVAFLRLWTRKEALLKAVGVGLAAGAPALKDEGAVPPWDHEWCVRSLKPAAGYAGAVAAEGRDWRLACGQWD
jgi:4'-phosphopantetheinyl transferase